MTPNRSQDLYGAALVAAVLAVQLFQARKARTEACEETVAKA